jgi:hypothetical protein
VKSTKINFVKTVFGKTELVYSENQIIPDNGRFLEKQFILTKPGNSR